LAREGVAREKAKPKAKPKRHEVRFERAEPNQLWQSDLFTFLLRRHERIYVAAFLDDHSRYLVSLSIAHHQRSALVLEALSRGIADYGAPKEILTDQGRQYTAWRGSTEFEAELKRHGIAHVKSRPHHPQTCGKIERFWKTMWEELLSRTVFADFDDCQRRVNLFVQHYNFQRPHQALDGQTPADRFFRSSVQVRDVVEKTVAENALRLAREQPPRPPFYLVGRLGDRDLTISARGAALQVRVGDEETTIPLAKEHDDVEGAGVVRWNSGRASEETEVPADAEVADELERARPGGEEPVPTAAVGVVGGGIGDGGDRNGQGIPGDVLSLGDASAQGGAGGPEPAGLECAGRLGGSVGGDCSDRGARGDGEAARAGAAEEPAAPVPDSQDDQGTVGDRSPRANTQVRRVFNPDVPWRELALIWERKLCGERAAIATENGEREHGRAQVELHTDAGGAEGADAQARVDHRRAGGEHDGVGGGTLVRAIAQPLPDDPASGGSGGDRGDRGETGRAAGEAERNYDAAGGGHPSQARECAAPGAGQLDRQAARRGERTAAWTDPADGSSAQNTLGERESQWAP
jgi:hypothetical protein